MRAIAFAILFFAFSHNISSQVSHDSEPHWHVFLAAAVTFVACLMCLIWGV